LLRQSADASIVFTTSTVGHVGRAYWGAYAVSKFGLEGLTAVLADELANTPIRVNMVNPGATRTNMRARAFPAEDAQTLVPPESVTLPYLYLLGAAGRGVNGQRLDAQPQRL
jgi:NAD(P)-dependent dehydrogenase (short-subunit alcohol dehydrogenase family)